MLKKIRRPTVSVPNKDQTVSLETQYRTLVEQGKIRCEPAQINALHHLQILYDDLLKTDEFHRQSVFRKRFRKKPANCRSVYLYGNVGRGKSMLMDLFFDACPIREKRRIHFHAFMLEVHEFVHQWRKRHDSDAIAALAKHIRESERLLCFDEFHVTDIADAMILTRLFNRLFELDIVVVMTSNCHPTALYQDGLQRDLFLPFIGLLQHKADVVELNAKQDFRLNHLHALRTTYYHPLDKQASHFILNCYNELTDFAPFTPGYVSVLGRNVRLTSVYENIVLTSFDELCLHALGPADYLAIGNRFDIVILAGIPKMTDEKCNEAKRFVTLIDALYEHRVKLICSAEVPAHELYTDGQGSFEFARTVSRLVEMQSEHYLHSVHLTD